MDTSEETTRTTDGGSGGGGSHGERSAIARSNLCDDYFDRLVAETSHLIWQRSLTRWHSESSLSSSSCSGSLQQEPVPSELVFAGAAGRGSEFSGSYPEEPHHHHQEQHHQEQQQQQLKPKRPMNAFMVWGQSIRRELHRRYSNVQNALLSKALGRVWRSMGAEQKEPYVRKANLIKAKHKREFPNYRYQPRRVQERRNNKSNMLIGIQLNHPVSQQHHPTAAARQLQQQQEHFLGEDAAAVTFHCDDGRQAQIYATSFAKRDSTVQTFEYHPYPLAAAASSSFGAANNPEQHFNYSQSEDLCFANDSCHHQHNNHHQQQQHQQHLQLQQSEPTLVYQSYQQFAYPGGVAAASHQHQQQQQQHQHQQQPLALAYEPRAAYASQQQQQQASYGANC